MIEILLVEDEDHVANSFVDAVTAELDVNVERVADRRSAEQRLADEYHFDLVVCDLRIPPYQGGIDTAAEHGLAVYSSCRRALPGTPVIFLTGVAEDNLDDLLDATSAGEVTRILRDGEELRMARLYRKDRLWECVQQVRDTVVRLLRVDRLRVDAEVPLGKIERRAAALSSLQWNAADVRVAPIGGGLSPALTLHAQVFDEHEDHRASTFLKFALLDECRDELARFESLVSGKLDHRAFPDLVALIRHCLGRHGCLVYKFADAWTESLFGAVSNDLDVARLIQHIRSLLRPWESMGRTVRVAVKDLRRRVIDDDRAWTTLEAELGEDFGDARRKLVEYEETELTIRSYPQHGDLHGENVLLDAESTPTLIDCGDVGRHPGGLDPITLEMSLLFHPNSPMRGSDWPSRPDSWMDLDAYVNECEHEHFIRACRQWAHDVVEDGQLRAVAYQQVMRQLKYPDTGKSLVVALAEGLASAD